MGLAELLLVLLLAFTAHLLSLAGGFVIVATIGCTGAATVAAAAVRARVGGPSSASGYHGSFVASLLGERSKSLYALGRLREKLKLISRAREAYEQLKNVAPKDDPARLAGLLRLGLLLELADKPREAAPLYGEIMNHAERGGQTFESARKRLEALTQDKTMVGK